ncbi:MAG: protein translocase subunit SecD [Candidatus Moranbacteria bacterium]|nr:protein translocase subunit SecD [Candidatus Moranbacteria bacterium]
MNIKNKRRIKFILVGILAALAVLIANPKKTGIFWLDQTTDKFQINLGLDLQGGVHLLYEADMSNIKVENKKESLEGIQDVVKKRIDAYGVSEPIVQTSQIGDLHRLIVELPGISNAEEAKNIISKTPLLEFKEQDLEAVLTDEEKSFVQDQKAIQTEKVNEILQKALSGENFVELARENSEDISNSEEGGDLGFFKKDDMVEEFSQAVFSDDLQNGEIYPKIVETEFGLHIIKKEDEKEVDGKKQIKASHILLLILDEERLLEQKRQSFKDTGLTGQQLEESQLRFNQQTNQSEVGLVFNDEGKDLFKEITERNQGNPVAIYLDERIISAPIVQSVIRNGEAVISGDFNIQEARELVQRLNAGALPVPINLISQQSIGPTLGKISLEKSLKAGLIGLVAVSIFMILYYRVLGLISVISLTFYTALMVSIFKVSAVTPFSITLTLSGIAGYILSVGMAVDANILIFERIKEEIRSGKSLRVAADEGFKRAWPSIRDGNVSTIITALILIMLGAGFIKGFALTLMIGVLISMFTAIVVTQMILKFILIERFEKYQFLFIAGKKLRKNKK